MRHRIGEAVGAVPDGQDMTAEQVTQFDAFMADADKLTPAFSWMNLLLWGGPFAVALLGAGLLVTRLRNRSAEAELSTEDAERVRRLSETDAA